MYIITNERQTLRLSAIIVIRKRIVYDRMFEIHFQFVSKPRPANGLELIILYVINFAERLMHELKTENELTLNKLFHFDFD